MAQENFAEFCETFCVSVSFSSFSSSFPLGCSSLFQLPAEFSATLTFQRSVFVFLSHLVRMVAGPDWVYVLIFGLLGTLSFLAASATVLSSPGCCRGSFDCWRGLVPNFFSMVRTSTRSRAQGTQDCVLARPAGTPATRRTAFSLAIGEIGILLERFFGILDGGRVRFLGSTHWYVGWCRLPASAGVFLRSLHAAAAAPATYRAWIWRRRRLSEGGPLSGFVRWVPSPYFGFLSLSLQLPSPRAPGFFFFIKLSKPIGADERGGSTLSS